MGCNGYDFSHKYIKDASSIEDIEKRGIDSYNLSGFIKFISLLADAYRIDFIDLCRDISYFNGKGIIFSIHIDENGNKVFNGNLPENYQLIINGPKDE